MPYLAGDFEASLLRLLARLLFFSCLLQLCILSAELGGVYPSYSNSEKDREVCRPSRQRGVHDGYDGKKQSFKMTDIFGVEKVWGAAYENNRQHGDVSSKKVTCFHIAYYRIFYAL